MGKYSHVKADLYNQSNEVTLLGSVPVCKIRNGASDLEL